MVAVHTAYPGLHMRPVENVGASFLCSGGLMGVTRNSTRMACSEREAMPSPVPVDAQV
jgi:hypothetical protein